MPTLRKCDVDPATWAAIQAAAGNVATDKPKRKSPSVAVKSSGRWSITLELNCRVISEANRRDHWTVQRRRAEIQAEALSRAIAAAGLAEYVAPLPLAVTWVRIGKGTEQDDDNLRRSFKALRDALAKWIDVDDGDPRVSWRYEQRSGEPAVEVRIGSTE